MKTILVSPPPFPFTTLNQHSLFLSRILPKDDQGCRIWAGISADGAGLVRIGDRELRAHRVAWMLAHGPIPPGFQIKQTCGDKYCCSPEHLVLVDPDTLKRPKPERKAGRPSKLTVETVCAIRRRHHEGETLFALSQEFGIAQSTIFNLCKGYTHKATPFPPDIQPQQLV